MKKSVIFVCLGNICRSPAAEGVMKDIVLKNNMENHIFVDSAGTIGYHTGEGADPRMKRHALMRGIDLTSRARKLNPQVDFTNFDYIITMDESNYENVKALDVNDEYGDKIYKMTNFCRNIKAESVPDPYYGGSAGFELVLDILEDACGGLLEKIKDDIKEENRR